MSENKELPFVHVIYGSQSGNSEVVAMDASDALAASGFGTKLLPMDELAAADLADMDQIVVVSSTHGEGDMPDNAQDFWESLENDSPELGHIRFAVLALGDSTYEHFCGAGRRFDTKFAELGAQRVLSRAESDLEYEDPAAEWIEVVVEAFSSLPAGDHHVVERSVKLTPADAGPATWSRQNPFHASVLSATRLSGPGSKKLVLDVEVDLADSGIGYEPGDSLGVIPLNPSELVDGMLAALGVDANDHPSADEVTWADLLSRQVELRLPNQATVAWAAEASGDPGLSQLLGANDRAALQAWCYGRDVLDLVAMVPPGKRDPIRVRALLSSMQHRSYSISSSPETSPTKVHLAVSSVEYFQDGRERRGAGTTTLRSTSAGEQIAVFLAPTPSFRLPEDDRSIIMVGPGVGVAPFLSFLQERRARAAVGRNWLFFGDQHEDCDFLYRDELMGWKAEGLLTELTTAFSRDQAHKIYVQDRILERGAEVFDWLEDGAYFYICGEGARMSASVEEAVVEVIARHGDMPKISAHEYLNDLKRQRRFSLDVY